MEKKRSDAKTLHKLIINDKEFTSQKDILEEVKSFYENMYAEQNVDKEKMKTMSKNITVKLTDEERISIEGNITEYECACALKSMKNNKSPGSDGITTEFYKIFWNDLKSSYIKSLNYSLQKQGIISLLHKKDKDLCSLNNWRPLTLLNTDYKIVTKAIANRIKKIFTQYY